jgi:hypothetical protein
MFRGTENGVSEVWLIVDEITLRYLRVEDTNHDGTLDTVISSGAMAEDPPGTYTGTIPAPFPSSGYWEIRVSVDDIEAENNDRIRGKGAFAAGPGAFAKRREVLGRDSHGASPWSLSCLAP